MLLIHKGEHIVNNALLDLLHLLQTAQEPEAIFGLLAEPRHTLLKRRYHELLHLAHPDHNSGMQAEANEAVKLLRDWYETARRAGAGEKQAKQPLIEVETPLHRYTGYATPLQGDLCDLFPAQASSEQVLLKIVRAAHNNDLLEAEARALNRIARQLADQPIGAHFPVLIEHLRIRDGAGAQRQTNVLRFEPDYVSLTDVCKVYPHGIHPADAAWMFNRLLAALGTIHDLGLVHGAVVLPHILIRPVDHNDMLIDWCYSVQAGAAIQAISPAYATDYPPEVSAKAAATPATDLYMAARCLVRLLGGNGTEETLPPSVPKPMRALLRACLIPTPQFRAQQAWQVFDDFQDLLYRLYGPPTFRPFHVPSAHAR